jgi:hypothetical protein
LPQATFYQGQLNRWVAHGAWHTNTTGAVPRGFRFEGPMGFAAPAGTPDTKMLYSCMKGSDEFPSLDAACGGNRVIGELGLTYTTPPANESVAPIFRCAANGSGELFMSHEANCEGQRVDGALGYVRQYAYLIRYREIDGLGEHWSGIHSVPANFRTDTPLGIVSTGGMEGTTDLSVCRKGTDSFLSVQPDCEGAQFVQPAGLIWKTPPAGVPSTELLRCKMTTTGELFESLDPGCEGQLKDRPLGYVRTTL